MSLTNPKLPMRKKSLRILVVTGIYPTKQRPYKGTFINSQIASLIAAGLEIEVIHPRPGPVIIRYISATIQVFLKTLTRQFDIVHAHYGQWCLFGRMQWTTPLVCSFLGTDLLDSINMYKSSLLVIRISRWLCHHVDAVIVKSEEMKKACTGGAIFVIPNGVDFELFHPIPRAEARTNLGWDQDRYYILFGGDPQRPEKNYPLAYAAIECLRTRGICAELVVANNVPQTRLVQFINASNVVILTSIYEGSPNIVKEAMACNVPVVATDVGDVSEVIGRTIACKVCSNDPTALAGALEEALRHSKPTTGRNDISHLERSVVAEQILAIYDQVVSKRSRKYDRKLRSRQKHYAGMR